MRPGKPQPFDYAIAAFCTIIIVTSIITGKGTEYAGIAAGILGAYGYGRGRNSIRQGRGRETLAPGDSEQGASGVPARGRDYRNN